MKEWIWGRIACLGKETIAHLGWSYPIVNHQKARADYVVDSYLDPTTRTRIDELDPEMFVRTDVLELQGELAGIGFAGNPPLAIVLDSFADLTDQRFYRKGRNWSFCSHYSDLDGDRLDGFDQSGLLPKEQIPSVVCAMIQALRSTWPEAPIFYLHFPATLDSRTSFQERAALIKSSLHRIQSRVDGVFSIEAQPNLVAADPDAPPELKAFPYHFHREVSLDLAAKIADVVEGRSGGQRSATGGDGGG